MNTDATTTNIALIELLLKDDQEHFIESILKLQAEDKLTTELYTSLLILTATVFNNFVKEPGQLMGDWLEHVKHATD